MRRNVGLLIGLVVLLAIAGGVYALAHKSSNPSTQSSNANPYNYNNQPAASDNSPAPAASGDVIQTKTSASVGKYLADGSGRTLYTYNADTQGKSNCEGSCLYNWPAYTASSSTGLPANVTVITRSDGSQQYAYKGLPLYYFTSDTTGQVTGNGVENFQVARP